MNTTRKPLMGWGTVWLAGLAFMAVLLPGLLVKRAGGGTPQAHFPASAVTGDSRDPSLDKEQPLLIPVYLSKQHTVETVPLEDYVRGVVAAEMPAGFEPEAMKAQAMAARTYMVRRILEHDFSSVPVQNAWVTDTSAHQAYLSEDELRRRGNASPEAAAQMERLNRAVQETKNLILTYEGKPINATFFSTSNGYTENSEDYWGDYTPYLRSVPSPWDAELSPRYKETVTFSYKELLQKLGVSSISAAAGRPTSMKVLGWTAGHRVKTIAIGGKIFTGKDVREKLGLNSSQFQWAWRGSRIDITTTGYGHGVGMSQWGADGMAKEGKTAEQIVKYYYQGIDIEKASSYLATKS
jgi:stage II sporulation protein D